jgi:signal transduction histidine kinase
VKEFQQRLEVERARDELRVLDAAKSRFTANVHHELRTPLTLALAPAEALLSGDLGELNTLQRDYLKTIHTNGLRLLKLINNLLDLAKIEGDQMRVKRCPMRVESLVGEVIESARALADRKGVLLELSEGEGVPEIAADREAVEKIVVNLLGNAIKFTASGGRIEIAVRAEEQGGVCVVVADTGVGIPAKQLGRIFDRFAQVDGSSTRSHEGTGIGLSLAKELVELHGGEIWAESEGPGRGARISFVLPRGESELEGEDAPDVTIDQIDDGTVAMMGRSIAAMEAELDFGGNDEEEKRRSGVLRLTELEATIERAESVAAPVSSGVFMPRGNVARDAPEVLVVEDNADMRRLLSFIVGSEFRVCVARNGAEALKAVQERRPDLVLTDVMMPELSGAELCRVLKEGAETAGIPVILVTSKAEREMKIEGLELGADDYVTKPFHPRELMARIRSLVRVRRLQEQLTRQNALLESTNEELRTTLDELKEASTQLVHAERLSALGELAAGVAHEVNNPVNFALNAAKALQECVEEVAQFATKMSQVRTDDSKEFVRGLNELQLMRDRLQFDERVQSMTELTRIVGEGLERTARLVGGLHDFAVPDRGARGNLDVARGLRSTIQLVSHSLASADIEIRVEIPTSLPTIQGELRALNQVFLNLIKNAAESLRDGGGAIEISAHAQQDAVIVEIRDDGPGIPGELRGRIFEPFFTTKASVRGSGLGLAISQRIVSQHGGSIEVEPAPDRGTIMRVRLPIHGVAALEAIHAP